jgi:hypothetical protein
MYSEAFIFGIPLKIPPLFDASSVDSSDKNPLDREARGHVLLGRREGFHFAADQLSSTNHSRRYMPGPLVSILA